MKSKSTLRQYLIGSTLRELGIGYTSTDRSDNALHFYGSGNTVRVSTVGKLLLSKDKRHILVNRELHPAASLGPEPDISRVRLINERGIWKYLRLDVPAFRKAKS